MKQFFSICLFLLLGTIHCDASGIQVLNFPSTLHNSPKSSTHTLDLFFTGKRYSNLEPCGCTSRQSGGLQFEATLYDREAATSAALRLDAGDWTHGGVTDLSPLDALKTRFLLRALAIMRFDAVNVGTADLRLSAASFKHFARAFPNEQPNLISANVYLDADPKRHAFATHRILRCKLSGGRTITVGITGVAVPPYRDLPRALDGKPSHLAFQPKDSGAVLSVATPAVRVEMQPTTLTKIGDFVIRPAHESLAPILAELRPNVDLLIVLHSGTYLDARKLADVFPAIDCTIVNEEQPLSPRDQPGSRHRPLVLTVKNMLGREVGLVHLEQAADSWRTTAQPNFLAVSHDLPARQDLVKLIEAFKQATKGLAVTLPGARVQRINGGAESCAPCHEKQHQGWKRTRHAQAMQTLIDRGQQFNPECLGCHTTNFQNANGFYSIKHQPSRDMMGVQCEVCHGPAGEHANIQRKFKEGVRNWMQPSQLSRLEARAEAIRPRRKISEATCLTCHTPEHDDRFAYPKKYQRIQHK